MAVIESKYAVKTNISTNLSEQEIIDCDEASNGCVYGYAVTAYLLVLLGKQHCCVRKLKYSVYECRPEVEGKRVICKTPKSSKSKTYL